VYSILLVEDSPETFHLVKLAIGQSAHLEWAKTLSEGYGAIEKKDFDLILLDLMLPDGDGFRFCSLLQANDRLKKTPVVFLSAKSAVADKVMGFSVGGEDYITKPFEPIELKARIEARLRKKDRERNEQDYLRLGDIEINRVTQRVHAFESGIEKQIELTPIEFKLLIFLSRKPNHVFSREEVLNSVWGTQVFVYSRSVDTHVSKLRKKLGEHSHYIQSVHGSGYRFGLEDTKDLRYRSTRSDGLAVSQFNPSI